MKGRPEKIDVLTLYAKSDHSAWNAFLTKCLNDLDLFTLEKVLYGIQLGMKDLAEKKMNSEKICDFFIRLQRSIENTMKRILRAKNPHPLDDPFNKDQFGQFIDSKKERDHNFEKHLKRIRF